VSRAAIVSCVGEAEENDEEEGEEREILQEGGAFAALQLSGLGWVRLRGPALGPALGLPGHWGGQAGETAKAAWAGLH